MCVQSLCRVVWFGVSAYGASNDKDTYILNKGCSSKCSVGYPVQHTTDEGQKIQRSKRYGRKKKWGNCPYINSGKLLIL